MQYNIDRGMDGRADRQLDGLMDGRVQCQTVVWTHEYLVIRMDAKHCAEHIVYL